MGYIIYRVSNGKKQYWSVTGKWVKSKGCAECQVGSYEEVSAKARELGGYAGPGTKFRN